MQPKAVSDRWAQTKNNRPNDVRLQNLLRCVLPLKKLFEIKDHNQQYTIALLWSVDRVHTVYMIWQAAATVRKHSMRSANIHIYAVEYQKTRMKKKLNKIHVPNPGPLSMQLRYASNSAQDAGRCCASQTHKKNIDKQYKKRKQNHPKSQ